MKLFQAVKAQQLVVRARCVAIACYGRLSVHAIAWSQVDAAGSTATFGNVTVIFVPSSEELISRSAPIRVLMGGRLR
jgi:hypothetical protein